MQNIVVHTAHSCLNSNRNFPGAVCLFPNTPPGLTETLEIKSRWSPLYATFFDSVKKEMPSFTSQQSWIDSHFISCWRRTQQDLNMRYQNITKHRFKEECASHPPPPLPPECITCVMVTGIRAALACLPPHGWCFCSCLHLGHWEASRRRGSESLPACEGT